MKIKKITEVELRNIINNTIQELLGQYIPNTSLMSKVNKKYINEALIMTYAPGKIKQMIKRNPHYHNIGITNIQGIQKDEDLSWVFQKEFNDTTKNNTKELKHWHHFEIQFSKGINTDCEVLNELINFLDKCGWTFMGLRDNITSQIYKNISECNIKEIKNTSMYFEPNYNKTVENDEIPDTCYHVTSIRNIDGINKRGLQPRTYGRTVNHQARVYLWTDCLNWKIDIAYAFRQSGENIPHVLLEIDMKELKNKVDFYPDTNFFNGHNAIYTFESIPPQYIKIIEKEDE